MTRTELRDMLHEIIDSARRSDDAYRVILAVEKIDDNEIAITTIDDDTFFVSVDPS